MSTQYEGSTESSFGDSTFTCRIVCSSDQLEESLLSGEFGALRICPEFADFNVQLGICLQALPDIVFLSSVATEGFTNTPQLLKIVPVSIDTDVTDRDIPSDCFSVTNAIVQREVGHSGRDIVGWGTGSRGPARYPAFAAGGTCSWSHQAERFLLSDVFVAGR